MLSPNEIVQHRYRIVRLLGQGGMGAVYEAIDERLGRRVAVKQMLVTDEHLRQAFAREAKLLANLRHASLPNVIDWFDEDGNQFIVMEFIGGDDLAVQLKNRRAPFPVEDVLQWADELLDALHYLHTQTPPVLHRDIKPANLKLTTHNRIILLDFGLAKGFAGGMTQVANDQSIYGYTPQYAPLEQIQGEGTNARSDLYALAASLYHLLTNVKPPDALTRATQIINEATDTLAPLRTINPSVSEAVERVIMRAMALKPAARFASASEMRAALRTAARENQAELNEATLVAAAQPPLFPEAKNLATTPQQVRQLDATTLLHSPHGANIPNANTNNANTNNRQQTPLTFNQPDNSATFNDYNAVQSSISSPPKSRTTRALWISVIIVAVVTCVGLLTFSIARYAMSTGPKEAAPQAAENPALSSVPPNLRGVLPSMALVQLRDANGKQTAQASGFFISANEVVTALPALSGATEARLRPFNSSGDLAAETSSAVNVSAVDRTLNLVVLRLSNGRGGSPANINERRASNTGARVNLLAVKADGTPLYTPATINEFQPDNSVNLTASLDNQMLGGAVADDSGTVIGVVTSVRGRNGATANTFAPIANVLAAMRDKQNQMSLAAAGAREVLIDFRQSLETDEPNISAATRDQILRAVFLNQTPPPTSKPKPNASSSSSSSSSPLRPPAGSLPSSSPADKSADEPTVTPEAALEPNEPELPEAEITASFTGAFTAAGVRETLYLIDMQDESLAGGKSKTRLAVFNGAKLAANLDAQGSTEIFKITDLNNDGINEILLGSGLTQMGETLLDADLIELRGGKLRRIYESKSGYHSFCGTTQANALTIAAIIFYAVPAKGKQPEFRIDYYTAPCTGGDDSEPRPDEFRYASTNQPPVR